MRTGAIRGIRLELKRAYRKNMALGFGFSSAIVIMVAAVVFLLSAREIPGGNPTDYTPQPPPLPPPIKIDPAPGPFTGPTRPEPPRLTIGELVPVPEEQAPDTGSYPRQIDPSLRVPYEPVEDGRLATSGFQPQNVLEDILPSPGTFIPFEEAPVPVKLVDPTYPELARKAGIEGSVWLNVLVDREGAVRDVLAAAKSDTDAGFEEAAATAARQCVWRPAIANGQPTAVWITYKVEFRLKH